VFLRVLCEREYSKLLVKKTMTAPKSEFLYREISSSFFIHHTNKIFCSTRMMMTIIIVSARNDIY
jgi:hypothetical protein